ncbi:ABC-type multidrug transport system fused ATPase/permease subunit [Motilibacter peucedani]|uniref:ABC-type multidrug transport system fused ATPase/permease subunit n=1 Tax=Motilibacter peucedani TaxID=598650 RepID=A0A420XTY5_9ACTN|nr:ABC transporter ATP-binding protein [Motilibacter peucedani]RKS80306.1 ABC-type multidrug transport system fused ATPase/permease subunit [Motilibacter peucedani]
MPLKQYLLAAYRTVPRRSQRHLRLVVLALALISVLDLVALVLVLGITALGSASEEDRLKPIPGFVRTPLSDVGISSPNAVVSTLGIVVVLLFVGKGVLAAGVLRRVMRFLARQEAALTSGLMAKLMRAPLTFHLPRRYIDVMTDITVGSEALLMKAVAPVVLIAAELVLVAMLTVGLLLLAPLVALGSLLYFTVVLTVLNRWIGTRARRAGEVDVDTTRSGMIVIQWALGGFREVVTRGVSDHFVDRVSDIRSRGAASRAEVAYLNILPRYFLESALVLGMAFAFAIQLPFVGFSGAVSGLALFAVTGFRLLPSLQRLQSSAALIRSGQPFGERALALQGQLDEALAVEARAARDEPELDVELELTQGVALEGVGFRYDGADRDALTDVSVLMPAGRMTAVVGSSGSGKSTLVDILLGLLPPSAGEVRVDGLPLRGVRRQWLSLVGYVPQSIFLMPATIRDNVALGVPHDTDTDQRVWDALRRASMDDVVRKLPGGLDFTLGDGGSGLSGGQRQRLGIARALFTGPQVLILDEATSALDVETEARITETLTQLEGLTKIVVAHRLSTVREADQVLFFREGYLVAHGTFDEVGAAVPDFARQVELSGLTSERVGP